MKSITLCFSLLLAPTMILAASPDKENLVNSKKEMLKNKSLEEISFAISSKYGELTPLDKKHYILTIPQKHITKVLAISNGDKRSAITITPKQYSEMVHGGGNSFDKTPPNAVVITGKSPEKAYEITSFSETLSKIIFKLSLLKNQKPFKEKYSGQVSLFVDSFKPGCSISSGFSPFCH